MTLTLTHPGANRVEAHLAPSHITLPAVFPIECLQPLHSYIHSWKVRIVNCINELLCIDCSKKSFVFECDHSIVFRVWLSVPGRGSRGQLAPLSVVITFDENERVEVHFNSKILNQNFKSLAEASEVWSVAYRIQLEQEKQWDWQNDSVKTFHSPRTAQLSKRCLLRFRGSIQVGLANMSMKLRLWS